MKKPGGQLSHHLHISVVVTVLNEAKTVTALLEALQKQTHLPDEVIIVDGGSSDETVKLLHDFQLHHPSLALKVLTAQGNRSVGRNVGIQQARCNLIAITDAGCIPHPDWLAELVAEYARTQAPIVAGYYDAQPQTAFQAAVVPYVLVMPDQVDPHHFLPATRSLLLDKKIWQKLGGFDERLSDNEDYAWAKKLESARVPMAFTAAALVTWLPRTNLRSFIWMIFRFARGDVQAGLIRPKVVALFGRYVVWLGLSILFWRWSLASFIFFESGFWLLYLSWSIAKNVRFAPHGWYWLPVLQISSDWAVMVGSMCGFFLRK